MFYVRKEGIVHFVSHLSLLFPFNTSDVYQNISYKLSFILKNLFFCYDFYHISFKKLNYYYYFKFISSQACCVKPHSDCKEIGDNSVDRAENQ